MNWYRRAIFEPSKVPAKPLFDKGGWQESVRRQDILYDAIRKMAQDWNVGPITEPLQINSRGDIIMLQKMSGINYINPDSINPELVEIARKYNHEGGGHGGNISGRWITLHHFTWERMLGDMGLLPRETTNEEEFLKQISK